MPIVNDRRKCKDDPHAFVVFEDSFMSGWGKAEGGVSFYALAAEDDDEVEVLLANGDDRSEFRNPRTVYSKAELLALAAGTNDHVSITDKANAERWYKPGGWS